VIQARVMGVWLLSTRASSTLSGSPLGVSCRVFSVQPSAARTSRTRRSAQKLGRRGAATERARERRETDEQLAERLVREVLAADGWTEKTLQETPKGDPLKVELARVLRSHTPMTRAWITRRLSMGSPSYLSTLLSVNDN